MGARPELFDVPAALLLSEGGEPLNPKLDIEAYAILGVLY